MHVSNKYLNLPPIVEHAARTLGKRSLSVDTDDDPDDTAELFGSTWILVSGDTQFFEKPQVRSGGAPLVARNDLRLWTDDFSNLYRILK